MIPEMEVGQRLRITQHVRIGPKSWENVLEGTFLGTDRRRTGIATDRRPEDDIWVEVVVFEKPNGERSTVVVDERTQIEAL